MGNTVGSLTQVEKSIIIGSLLGDGYLRIIPGRKNAFLEINHSVSQKEYVDWKFRELRNIVKSPPKERKGKEKRIAYRFFTRQHPELTELYLRFYANKVKIIPNLKLDPLIVGTASRNAWYDMALVRADRVSDTSIKLYAIAINTYAFNFELKITKG